MLCVRKIPIDARVRCEKTSESKNFKKTAESKNEKKKFKVQNLRAYDAQNEIHK